MNEFINTINQIGSRMREVLGPRTLARAFFWNCIPGQSLRAPWPEPVLTQEAGWGPVWNSDPDYHYAPWLTENLGRQFWNWDMVYLGDHAPGQPTVVIRIPFWRRRWASVIALRWT
jgi:hypothetical protein